MSRAATCHPDRPHRALGLCRACYMRGWYRAHAGVARATQMKVKFGITAEDYASLLAAQGGVCAICGSPPNGRALAVDHDHATGAVRGLLCDGCNLGLGHIEAHIERAAAYISEGK